MPGFGDLGLSDQEDALEHATRVMVITRGEESGLGDGQAEDLGKIRVSNGVEPTWVDAADLASVGDASDVDHATATRLFSHAKVTPSPRCTAMAKEATWNWLTVEGLGEAGNASFSVAPSAMPHLLGRGGGR